MKPEGKGQKSGFPAVGKKLPYFSNSYMDENSYCMLLLL
jgi:hypothetical protein